MFIHVNDENFQQEVLESKLPVLVIFYSEWCVICQKLFEFLEETLDEYQDILKIVKANSEHTLEKMSSLKIHGIPTIFLYKSGNIVKRLDGFHSKKQLKEFLEKHI